MQVSLATIFLFFALTPGIFFLLGVRSNPAGMSPKDVFDSPMQEILGLLSVSTVILITLFIGALHIFPHYADAWLALVSKEFMETCNYVITGTKTVTKCATEHLTVERLLAIAYPPIIFGGLVYLISYFAGTAFPSMRFKLKHNGSHVPNGNLKQFLYNVKPEEMVFAWVLTTTSHDSKHLMYLGLLRSVKIEHDIVTQVGIAFPSKTYIDFDVFLKTTHTDKKKVDFVPREITSFETSAENLLYIPQSSIANIYFEKF